MGRGYGGRGFEGRSGFGLWRGLLWRGMVGLRSRGGRGLGEKMKGLGKEHSWGMEMGWVGKRGLGELD